MLIISYHAYKSKLCRYKSCVTFDQIVSWVEIIFFSFFFYFWLSDLLNSVISASAIYHRSPIFLLKIVVALYILHKHKLPPPISAQKKTPNENLIIILIEIILKLNFLKWKPLRDGKRKTYIPMSDRTV